jgi:hypothetical protein
MRRRMNRASRGLHASGLDESRYALDGEAR